jgi:GNAT superfamily N-acetyltransferase
MREQLGEVSQVTFVIRDATVDDAEATARVSADSWRSSYRGILPDDVLASIDISKRAAKRREILARGAATHLVACDAVTDEIVGFCDAGANRDDIASAGEVYAIYLIERAKRQGLGRAMFERAQASLRTAGMTAMSVWVIETNVPARRFYEALGGRPGARKDIVINGASVIEVAYEWDL